MRRSPQIPGFFDSDADYWEFMAGGGEDDETPLQAAEREVEE